jgi:hypothetical protein
MQPSASEDRRYYPYRQDFQGADNDRAWSEVVVLTPLPEEASFDFALV